MQVCSQPGCPQLTQRGRCETHRRAPDRRPSSTQRGYDSQHREDRAAFLEVFPICQHHEGCLEPATDLDHVDGNPANRDWGNYRALCHSHHSKRTATDQPGGWNA